MIHETTLYTPEEQFPIERSLIDAVAVPVGDHYGDEVFDNYLNHYCGVAKRYKPKRIFEIGVRYGYTAISMLLGAKAAGVKNPEYIGIDDESYHQGSCNRANENLAAMVPFATAQALKWNSITQEMPAGIGMFDLVSVDGNHDRWPVLNDLEKVWPLLNPGGIVLLDDATIGCQVYWGIQDFLARFIDTQEVVETCYVPTLRNHFLIRKL